MHALLSSRPRDFRVTVLDQSPAMVEHCMANVRDVGEVGASVGRLEAMPYATASFDVTLALGALEYTDVRAAVRELSRVTRPGGLVVVTMLNPLSLYRAAEWTVYWPTLRVLAVIERSLNVPADRRHGARHTGIRALRAGRLRRLMTQAGLQPAHLIYFDLMPLIPPLDRLAPLARWGERSARAPIAARGGRRWTGTAYLLTARRSSLPRSGTVR